MAAPINPTMTSNVAGSGSARNEGVAANREREKNIPEAQESAAGESADRVSLSDAARQSAVGVQRDVPALSLQTPAEAQDLVSRLRELMGGNASQAMQAQAGQIGSQLPTLLQAAAG